MNETNEMQGKERREIWKKDKELIIEIGIKLKVRCYRERKNRKREGLRERKIWTEERKEKEREQKEEKKERKKEERKK